MANFKSFNEFETYIKKEMKQCTQSARDRMDRELFMNVNEYYTGTPKVYKRTGTLLNAPASTEVEIKDNGKSLEFATYMDESISYRSGSFSGADVINATEYGRAGTIGNHGYFQKTDDAVDEILEDEFSNL